MTGVFLQFLSILTACGARGTTCSCFVAMRFAGITQSLREKSNSFHAAQRNSPERTNSREPAAGRTAQEIAVMPLKVQHNLTEFPGVERGGSVPCLSGTQRSGQVFRGVPRGLAGGDGIAAYLAADIRQPASSAQFPGLPQRFDGAHNVLGGNVCHGLAAEDGKEIFRHPRIMKER